MTCYEILILLIFAARQWKNACIVLTHDMCMEETQCRIMYAFFCRHRMVCIGVAGSSVLAHHFTLQLSMAQRRSKSEPPKTSFAEDPCRPLPTNIHPMPAKALPPISIVDKRWNIMPHRNDILRRLLPIAHASSGDDLWKSPPISPTPLSMLNLRSRNISHLIKSILRSPLRKASTTISFSSAHHKA